MTLPNPNQEPSLNERMADIMLRMITTGGIAGGGFGAFWYLFQVGDVPKAIASLTIGIGISYGARLLGSLHEASVRSVERLGRETGEAVAQKVEQLLDRISTNLAGFDDKYLECQALECQSLHTEGATLYDNVFTPLLEEVFIPLELSVSQSTLTLTSNEITIWDLLRQADREPTFRQIAILAAGGLGKTTLLEHVTYTYSKKQQHRYRLSKKIPVLLKLRQYQNIGSNDYQKNLADLITFDHIPHLPGAVDLKVHPGWANEILISGKAVVMLDGFDEVREYQRQTVSSWINLQMRRYPQSIFIITSRPVGYAQGYLEPKLPTTLFVRGFSLLQQEYFIKQWYFSQERYAQGGRDTPIVRNNASQNAEHLMLQIRQRPELQAMAQNPLLLTMIANVHRSIRDTLPQRRVELYQEIFRLQLGGRPKSKRIAVPFSAQESQILLQHVALSMVLEDRIYISKEELLNVLTISLSAIHTDISPNDFISYIQQVSGLLIEREFGEYQFTHLSFQMYLAAIEIYQKRQEDLLLEHSKDTFWQEIISLYVEQLKDPRSFIRKLVAPISNPYIVGSPVTGDIFVGREDILRRFEELWSTPGQIPSVVLYGHRRMGKTSILRNLAKRIEKDLIIDFNMQRVGYVNSTGELLYNLALALYYAIPEPQRQNLNEPSDTEFLEKNSITSFDRFLKKIDPLRGNRRVIITIDEFEIIERLIENGQIDSRLLDFWRSLIQTYSWFVMVFAGLHTLHEMTHDYWNPLFGSVQFIPVTYLSQKATELLIAKPSPDFDLEYTPEAISLIYSLTYGQPYLVQLICHNLVTYFNRERFEQGIYRGTSLTTEDVETITHTPEFYRDGDAYFYGIWEQAKEVHGQEQLQILQVLSRQPLTISELSQETSISSQKIQKALKTLEQHDVIQRQGNSYTYRVELMRRWVVRQQANKSMERTV